MKGILYSSFEGEFKHNSKTISYVKAINNERTKIEMNLRKGGYYFFGSRYKAVSVNASSLKKYHGEICY